MYHNPFSFIRKARVFTSLLVAVMTNSMVFASPVSQALHNFSASSSMKSIAYGSSPITVEDFRIENSSSSIGEEVNNNMIAVYSEIETHGEIGIQTMLDADYVQDNYFTVSIPNLELHQDDYAVLRYDLYGVDVNSATKSINNQASYGGERINKEAGWKKVEEYLPLSFLHSGENEIFFNRYKEATYAYQVKNVQIHFQKELEVALHQSKEDFENTW